MSKNGLLIGRWQTLHGGHDWLVQQLCNRGLDPVMAVRDTPLSELDPLSVSERILRIQERYAGHVRTIVIPDIRGVYYGRDVGYEVVQLDPPEDIKRISGRALRAQDSDR